MRVLRSTYRGAAEWRAQRRALQAAGSAEHGLPLLEPAVVVSEPDEHTQGAGVLIEAVGPDGGVLYQRLIPDAGRGDVEREEAIEAAIQEAWRQLVQHVGPPEEDADGRP